MTSIQKKILAMAARAIAGQLGIDLVGDETPREGAKKGKAAGRATLAAALGGSVFWLGRTIVTIRNKVEKGTETLRALEEKVGLLDDIVGSHGEQVTRLHQRVEELERHVVHLRENVREIAAGTSILSNERGAKRDLAEDPL